MVVLFGFDPLSFLWVTNRQCGDSERDLVICLGSLGFLGFWSALIDLICLTD